MVEDGHDMSPSSKTRRLGTDAENRVVDFFKDHGFPDAERLPFNSPHGDIDGVPGVVVEVKYRREKGGVALAQWMDEARAERDKAGAQLGVVVFPRRNCATARAFVLLELADFVELVR